MNKFNLFDIQKITIFITLLSLTFITAYSQEYSYDGSGNLSSDGNKSIVSIHYNHLNLVDTIIYEDGRKLIYTYSGSGQKLREQTILADGTVKQKRDYTDHVLYTNDTLSQIQNEDGRVVPAQPGDTTSPLEYQYHLKDHLGNVRTTLTSKQDTDHSTATLETANLTTEQSKFLRYQDIRRVSSILMDHTNGNSSGYAERLNGSANEKYGLAKSLSVMPGDVIQAEVYTKYVDPNSANWTAALTTLMGQITSNTTGIVIDGTAYTSSTSSFPTGLANLQNTTTNGAPRAYLNWLIFDYHYQFLNGGFQQISTAGRETGTDVAHEHISSPSITITQPGYVYIYLSNEETSPVEVFFDDFAVTQVKGPIIQQVDYDPFGLTLNEYSRENSVPNNFLYNGKELQKDFDLNLYDYGARRYDAALGRWNGIDSEAEKYSSWSPYNYVMNNPLKFIDPNGENAQLVLTQNGQAVLQADYYVSNSKDMAKALDAGDVLSELGGKYVIHDEDGKAYKLYFSISVIQVKAGINLEGVAQDDPIGNTFSAAPEVYSDGEKVAGATQKDMLILVANDASNITNAHEMIHSMLGMGKDEHSQGSIMDRYDDGQTKMISRKTIRQIEQTYGLVKGKGPAEKPGVAESVSSSGEVKRRWYLGSNFRTIHEPQISNEDIIKQFPRTTYPMQQEGIR